MRYKCFRLKVRGEYQVVGLTVIAKTIEEAKRLATNAGFMVTSSEIINADFSCGPARIMSKWVTKKGYLTREAVRA